MDSNIRNLVRRPVSDKSDDWREMTIVGGMTIRIIMTVRIGNNDNDKIMTETKVASGVSMMAWQTWTDFNAGGLLEYAMRPGPHFSFCDHPMQLCKELQKPHLLLG
jgi:hypothetical protein